MLRCKNMIVRAGGQGPMILSGASAEFLDGGLNAVIGPSGCGKTTLMKAILGILPSEGEAYFGDQKITRSEDLVGHVGFAPQFSIAQSKLTVEESIRFTLQLNVADAAKRKERLENILETIGLAQHREKRVESLSGGQLRRLGLGLEMTLDPQCLVCDEVTSGLDPLSEDQILALLRQLSERDGKTFLCIIHNLAKLELFDRITVVYEGDVVFQGNNEELCAYFGIPDALHLYDLLNQHELSHWQERWAQAKQALQTPPPKRADHPTEKRPSMAAQLMTLLSRRMVLFFRDTGYLWLTLAITFGFPCLVVIFALDGLPQIESLALERVDTLQQMQEEIQIRIEKMETASLVTGLIMFQVILLTLMGSNNGAREIAGERTIYEKERLSGLSVGAYALSKLIFVGVLAALQGAWMTAFVKVICQFPGPWLPQIAVLAGVCVSMTLVCLGFSALFRSAEKASLLSIYLVGFQLPLSGVVLALPSYLIWVCRPFINAYWGWGGYMSSMIDSRIFDAYRDSHSEWITSPWLALTVLGLQGAAGIVMVAIGCSKKQW
ncbi:ATP-binding cassette domain-containing protein [Cerasicoccus fimbriatus]|uniref:ATP-binding cassette domain-containing protein n=1 Tax=Cerasicoccus fimbriatus TaxID=3014554 RepID=UPI0022B2B4C5|nr:ATP-binding cassette domain-containing protein [Cerasicoccus sp. TK19100]